LRQAAFQVDEPVILTIHLCMPISEHLDIRLQLMHFQHWFPTGEADAIAERDYPVEMNDWDFTL